ncbi:MAG: LysM domain-containing protein [Chloroflexi bacterium]|nr:LysM domain-containing protein [Chloroflexota bacterium]
MTVKALKLIHSISPLFLALALGFGTITAQAQTCSETVESAFASLAEHCGDLARDSICYGSPQADAAFASDGFSADFASPGDRASTIGLAGLETGALDLAQGQWGIAALHLSANLPQTADGPGVIVLLAGEAALINEVSPGDAMEIRAPVSTAVLEETTLYKHPGVIPEPVAIAEVDDLLLVDAYENTGQWLRVVNDGNISWVEADKVARLQAMDGLPHLGLGATFAVQALSLATGTDYPECADAEPWIAIQTPNEMGVSLSVNGVDIHLGSMVTIQQVHRNALSMTVHRGEVTTIFGGTVQQSESIIGILGETDERDATVMEWSGALRGSDAEYERGQRAQGALNALARANGWAEYEAYNYLPDLVHIVKAGETLYGLTARYETSVHEIIAANGGGDSLRLLIGMELIIPKAGSGFAWRGATSASDG